jgi:RHS repeat-associated protein
MGQARELTPADWAGKGMASGKSEDQVTKYVYGTTTSESGVASSLLLRAVIYPDSDDADAPLGNGTDGVFDRVELSYNRLGQVIERKDQNQTVHDYDYDKLGRLLDDRVTGFGSNIDQAIKRISRTYDVRGMLKKNTSYDNATVGQGTVKNEVQFDYNNFGQLTSDWQEHGGAVNTSSTPRVQYGYADGSSGSNQVRGTTLTYPNGRVLTYGYGTSGGMDDELNRVDALIDDDSSSTHLADYTYLGAAAPVRVDYPQPQVRLDLWGGTSGSYAGLDSFDRVTRQLWHYYGGTPADRDKFTYGYDRNSNRLFKQNDVSSAFSELYHANGSSNGYDGLDRLNSFSRGTLSDSNSDGVPDTVSTSSRSQSWNLDALGNWSSVTTDGTTENRTHNAANEVLGWDHDGNGNIVGRHGYTDSSNYTQTFDAWNRAIQWAKAYQTITYSYDGLGRRIKRTDNMALDTDDFYYSNSWRLLEEHDNTYSQRNLTSQYVWGLRYVDEMVERDRDTDGNGSLNERLYVLQDANFNVTAITDTAGAVVERYLYDPYGQVKYADSSWAARSTSSYDWTYLHQGGRLDGTTGLYAFRHRDYSPSLGRWIERDPVGYVDGANLYEMEISSPPCFVDPAGDTISVGIPEHPNQGDKKFENSVLNGLAAACPCFQMSDGGWVGGSAEVVNGGISTSPDEFCACAKSHKGGCQLVYDLLQSQIDTFIEPFNGLNGHTRDISGGRSEIQWNPSFSGFRYRKSIIQRGSTAYLVLVHELVHSWTDQWMSNSVYKLVPGTKLPYGEVYSVQAANQIGKEMKLPGLIPRTTYDRTPVPTPNKPFFKGSNCTDCNEMYENMAINR